MLQHLKARTFKGTGLPYGPVQPKGFQVESLSFTPFLLYAHQLSACYYTSIVRTVVVSALLLQKAPSGVVPSRDNCVWHRFSLKGRRLRSKGVFLRMPLSLALSYFFSPCKTLSLYFLYVSLTPSTLWVACQHPNPDFKGFTQTYLHPHISWMCTRTITTGSY